MMKRLIAAWLLCLGLMTTSIGWTNTLGPSLPVAAFDGGGGTVSWVNPGNASATDGVFATITGTSTATVYNEFDFNQFGTWTSGSIPSGAIIMGVQIDIKGKQSAASTFKDTNVQLCNGAFTHCSTNLATNLATTYTTTNAVVSYGGSTNMIGAAWVPADFDATTELFLDVAKAAGSTSQSVSIDSVQITVTYSVPATGGVRHYISMTGIASSGTDAGNAGGAGAGSNPPTGFATHWDQAPMWFTSIASSGTAAYTNIHISGDAGSTGIYASNGFGHESNYEITATNSDPSKSIVEPVDWSHRATGSNVLVASVHVPASFVAATYPDIADPAGGPDTPNNPGILYNSDTGDVRYLNATTRPDSSTNLFGYVSSTGTHGGSQTSGGYITQAELTAGNINHAVGVVIYANKYMTTTGHGTGQGTGIFAPALAVDSYFPSNYGGTDTTFGMGSRLAIPAATTCASLGASSGDALTVCTMMKAYGLIVVDDSAWDFAYLEAAFNADSAMSAISGTTMANMFHALQHVRGVTPGD